MYSSLSALNRPARIAVALLAGLSLACAPIGCSGKKAAAKADAASSDAASTSVSSKGPNPFPVNHDDWAKIGYRLDWMGFPFRGSGPETQLTMIRAYGDIVVAQDQATTVSLLEATTGRTRWSAQLAGPLTKFVSINRDPVDPNRLLVSSESEEYSLAVPNGNILGRDPFARVVNTEPVINGDIAVYGCSTGEVLGHLVGHGLKAWGFLSSGSIDANPVAVGEVIGAVSQAGDVMFLTDHGALVGRAHIFGGLDTNPVAEGNTMYLAGRDQSIWAFDTSGHLVWRHRTSYALKNQPAVHAGVVYVEIPNEGMTALDGATGKVLWASPSVQGVVIGVRAGKLLVNKNDLLMTVDAAHGDVIERIKIPGVVKLALDKFVDGNLYAVSDRSIVAKFIPR
jgi:hypothetical protein